jgi:hypothetical protein
MRGTTTFGPGHAAATGFGTPGDQVIGLPSRGVPSPNARLRTLPKMSCFACTTLIETWLRNQYFRASFFALPVDLGSRSRIFAFPFAVRQVFGANGQSRAAVKRLSRAHKLNDACIFSEPRAGLPGARLLSQADRRSEWSVERLILECLNRRTPAGVFVERY